MQYFARVIVSLLSPVPFPSRAIFCTAFILYGLGGTVASHVGYTVLFFCLRAAVLETPQSAAQTAPLAGEPWSTSDISKTFPQGNHGVSEKVG